MDGKYFARCVECVLMSAPMCVRAHWISMTDTMSRAELLSYWYVFDKALKSSFGNKPSVFELGFTSHWQIAGTSKNG
jgi:hypothetical protein